MNLRKTLAATAVAALVGTGLVAGSATTASAREVCNQWGHCWWQSDYGYHGYYHSDWDRWHHRDYDHWRDRDRYYHHDYDRDRDWHHDRDYDDYR